ncbi:MAG: FprA family A-type flavoprotein [Clostridiales bacterium]|nr:FprA family A-type flavoprotein [Clostridiales bacterium]
MNNKLTQNVYSVGVKDPELRVFDVVMHTDMGTTYNSYLIKGSEKTVLVEMVKDGFYDEHVKNIKELIDIAEIDYIVVSHCEPDHSGSLEKFLKLCPNVQIVGSRATSNFLPNIVNKELDIQVVGDGDTISLGDINIEFTMAPFLHWPDTIFTYVKEDRLLITSDVFGCHYYNAETIYDDVDDLFPAQDYYYKVIMEPYRPHVVSMLKKIEGLDIKLLCPAHGPIIKRPSEIVNHYKQWTKDVGKVNDPKKAVITYVSAYGYTRTLAGVFEREFKGAGYEVVSLDAQHVALGDILKEIDNADVVMFGSPTFNRDALEPIWNVMTSLSAVKYRNIPAAAFGSYGWSGEGSINLTARLKQLGFKITDPFRARLKPSDEEIGDATIYIKEFILSIESAS